MRLSIETPELTPEQSVEFLRLRGKLCRMLLHPEAAPTDEQAISIEGTKVKTPSQRLRAALYVLWEHRGKAGRFDDWYAGRMEHFIEQVKERIP